MTSAEAMKKLANRARTDPQFFHELVFDPEKVISGLSFLDQRSRQALLRVNPDTIIRNLFPGDVMECGGTCGDGSCTSTCGAGSCLDTCKSSCGSTCGAKSCDHTSGMGKIIPEDPLNEGIATKGVGTKRVGGAAARKRQR